IAPSTGAMSLRKPVNPYVYNLRSSYQSEAHRAVEQIVGMGITRIGLIYVDDPFGVEAVAGVMDGLVKSGARAAYIEKFARKEATELLRGSKTHREMKVSPSLLEGVAAAKLLVAALQMTPGASPKQLTDVLQSGVAFDVGWPGYRVAYTPTDHSGIDFVDLSIVSSTGGFRR